MPSDTFFFRPMHLMYIAWHFLLSFALVLFTACGGGGGGATTTVSNPNTSPPTVSLAWSSDTDPATNVYRLVPTYSYGTPSLSWTDLKGAQSITPTASGTPITVTPSQTTTYSLTVSYQDPASASSKTLTIQANPATATPKTSDISLQLTSSSSSVSPGASITLTPTFAWSGGSITKSVINDGSIDTIVVSGKPVDLKPSATTTYTLRLEYSDQRVNPDIAVKKAETSLTISVCLPCKVDLGGNLNTARSNHVAVQLPNNLVLVTGGSNGTTALKSSELYDPIRNKWTATSDMGTARTGHTAVLLASGKVLVAGGFDGKATLNTAEIYDPSSGAWAPTIGTMNFTHNYHTATVLADGKVLIAGGVLGPATNVDATATEIYDPTLGTFSAGPNLPSARQGHTSTVLTNGKVLFVGSSIGSSTKAHILSYTSPATFVWQDLATPAVVTGSLTNGRWNHSATLLPNGKVLVAGGFGTNPNSAELYDPATNAWTSAGSLANGRSMHTSTLLRNGKVLIIGGFDGVNVLSSIEQYDPTVADPTKGWSTYAKILNTPRAMHTSTLLSNDKVLVSGTYLQGSGTVSSSSELWAP